MPTIKKQLYSAYKMNYTCFILSYSGTRITHIMHMTSSEESSKRNSQHVPYQVTNKTKIMSAMKLNGELTKRKTQYLDGNRV